MHSYLRSVGFRNEIRKRQWKEYLDQFAKEPDYMKIIQIDEENNMVLMLKEVAKDMGIAMCGEEDEHGQFHLEYYYPYSISHVVSSRTVSTFSKQGEKDSYAGLCEDYRVGVSLIYYLTNFMEMREFFSKTGRLPKGNEVCFTGLSDRGKIILPIRKTKQQIESAKIASQKRTSMIESARSGDASAMESLTLDEMNLYTKLNRQISKCDMYTLIDSFFMPTGVECDQYSLMGDIEEVELLTNSITKEEIYRMMVVTNDIPLSVVINKDDLLGVPEKGRRFKGKIWMMGDAVFS